MDLSGNFEANEAGTHCKHCGWAVGMHQQQKCIDAHREACTPIARALATQVGGGHYKEMRIQPVEYIHANGIPFIEGAVIKYVSRWRSKGGIEDIKKARHFLDLLIELEEKAP